jgi:hypothetical protein
LEIKHHPFFKDIDWDSLLAKKITPPFKPKIKSDIDTSFFDDEFTKQQISESVTNKSVFNDIEKNEFEGFTFSGSEQELKKVKLSVDITSSVNDVNSNTVTKTL